MMALYAHFDRCLSAVTCNGTSYIFLPQETVSTGMMEKYENMIEKTMAGRSFSQGISGGLQVAKHNLLTNHFKSFWVQYS
jgi:hypothetical protein